MADKADIRHGMELGADNYLTKPFTTDELLAASPLGLLNMKPRCSSKIVNTNVLIELQQKVQELQQYANTKGELLKQFQQELHNVVPRLNIAIHMLKNLQTGAQREHCLKILQEACTDEIALLNQMPNLQNILTAEDVNILSEFGIVKLTVCNI